MHRCSSHSLLVLSCHKHTSMKTTHRRFSLMRNKIQTKEDAPTKKNMRRAHELRLLRNFFDDLGNKVGVHKLDDWYQKISLNVITEYGGEQGQKIMNQFSRSRVTALMTAFPEHEWTPWRFSTVPKGFWNNKSNHRKFFDWLGKQIGIQTLDDWYEKLTAELMNKNGGSGLLERYKESPTAALIASYPEHNWIPWKFNTVPRGFWKDPANQRKFFDDVGKQIGIQNLDDWYQKLSVNLVVKYGGMGMVHRFKDSPQAALMASYPEHHWIPWKFNMASKGYWQDISNQKTFLDEFGKEIGVQTLDDWYEKFNNSTMNHPSMQRMLRVHGGSLVSALKVVYPEHNWVEWKFQRVSRGFWKSKDNVGAFLAELSEKLSIQSLDDWYRVDWIQMNTLGAGSLISKQKGLYNILKEQYPHHPWDPKRFTQVGKKAQRWLAITLKKMFPDEEILEDYSHPKAVSATKRPLQLDVYIPSRSLAFEYQGKQHYEEVGMFSPTRTYQQRDEEKRALCAANNIKLIEVPYWWNRTKEELQDIINRA